MHTQAQVYNLIRTFGIQYDTGLVLIVFRIQMSTRPYQTCFMFVTGHLVTLDGKILIVFVICACY